MSVSDNRLVTQLRFAGDFLVINFSFLIGYWLKFGQLSNYFENSYLAIHLFFNLAWIACAYFLGAYKVRRPSGNIRIIIALLQLLFLHFLLVVAFNGLIKTYYSRLFLLYTYASILLLVPLWRIVLNSILKLYRKGGFNNRNVLLVGKGSDLMELKQYFLAHPEEGYQFKGNIGMQAEEKPEAFVQRVKQLCMENQIHELYCSINRLQGKAFQQLVEFAENNLMRIRMVPETEGFPYKKLKVEFYDHVPVLAFRPFPLDDNFNRVIKRLFDILFSTLIIVTLLWWLIPLLAIFIKLESKGPVFFIQKRSGKTNSSFSCYKLRSMELNADANTMQAQLNDPRVTKVGAVLRKYNLDELPQFFNSFIGNMSVVGPRPHMEQHTLEYGRSIDKYMLRHHIKPGITGLSQVLGYRGETSEREMRNRVKVDIFYMENWSFLLDLKVVFLTVWNTVRKRKMGN